MWKRKNLSIARRENASAKELSGTKRKSIALSTNPYKKSSENDASNLIALYDEHQQAKKTKKLYINNK